MPGTLGDSGIVLINMQIPPRRDLLYGKRDLLYGKRDLLYGKRDLLLGTLGDSGIVLINMQILPRLPRFCPTFSQVSALVHVL